MATDFNLISFGNFKATGGGSSIRGRLSVQHNVSISGTFSIGGARNVRQQRYSVVIGGESVTWRSGSVSGGGLLVTSTNEGAMQLDLGNSLQRQTVGGCDVASNCLISFFDDAFSYFDGFTSDMASDAQATGAGSVTLLHGGLHFTGPRWVQGTRCLVFRVPLEQWNLVHYFTKAYVVEDQELVVIDQDGTLFKSLCLRKVSHNLPR
ncbi:uncharacterized protein ACA1_222100 [Acanthamoeba castellanii str. Neff]|uniref:Choice-of-anchor A domain-containing protein n=1 Tax=Acanthamoeba castellanii (strain ATCC 30010 / Neff) TaxID=1257118 RepID=L8GS40_ACACF|nr:uncharacterized protein ACA1_222100 [Acanthamoeba castellanii str. Neff]ELR15994.1 hypothetical protein ACA1_222100 [Acanthamoeba castellanii str. Neff]